jgi:hypothetical protein
MNKPRVIYDIPAFGFTATYAIAKDRPPASTISSKKFVNDEVFSDSNPNIFINKNVIANASQIRNA